MRRPVQRDQIKRSFRIKRKVLPREWWAVLHKLRGEDREEEPCLLYLAARQKDKRRDGNRTQMREGWKLNGLCDFTGKKCPE